MQKGTVLMIQIICLLISSVLIAVDQIIKFWADKIPRGTHFIPGLFDLTCVKNYGAAYSLFQNKQFFLITVTSIAIVVLITYMFVKRVTDKLLLSAITLIVAGGIGNLIDRIRLGYVIDYMEFLPFDFPIFNFADCCIVIGTGLFILYLLLTEIKEHKAAKEVSD